MKIVFVVVLFTLFTSCACGQHLPSWETPAWDQTAPGVWKAVVGKPDSFNLLTAAASQPRLDRIKLLPAKVPAPHQDIAFLQLGNKTYLRFPLERREDIFGLGLNFQRVRQNGTIQELRVDHWGGRAGRTHAPVPFFVSSQGYGVFINAARYMKIYVGTGVRTDSKDPPPVQDRNRDRNWNSRPRSDVIEVIVPTQGVELYVFGGPTPLDAVRRFNLFCGGGCLPPKWGLGFTHRTPTRYTDQQVLQEVAEFEQHNFPLDVIGLEPGWHSHAYPCSFEWDKERFPDPAGFANKMAAKHVRLNLWMNPYVAPKFPLYEQLKDFAGSHTVWNGIVPDYSLPAARAIFQQHLANKVVAAGAAGFKIDEVDGYDNWLWPDVATFPSGHDAEQMRQTYGVMVQRIVDDLYRARNERTYGLVRGTNAGAVRFPFVIYNDAYSHQDFITALCSSSFCGLLWTPEVRSSKSGEEWLRRMQSVCFSPMAMLNAWSSGTKPWSFPEVTESVRDVAFLRMRLMPYLYTAFAQYYFNGVPPVRAMPLVEGYYLSAAERSSDDPRVKEYSRAIASDVRDQFLFGDALLVAPVFAGQKQRKVILPAGKWYDFHTGAYAGQRQVLTVTTQLDRIPVFVRDGGIVPLMPARRYMPLAGERIPLEVRYYGTKQASFQLYDDDGNSRNFENGDFNWIELRASRNDSGDFAFSAKSTGPADLSNYNDIQWVRMTNTE